MTRALVGLILAALAAQVLAQDDFRIGEILEIRATEAKASTGAPGRHR